MAERQGERESRIEVGQIPIDAVPALARLAVGAWARGAVWGVSTTLRATRRLGEAAVSGESAAQLVDDVREELIGGLRELLGIVSDEEPEPISGVARAIAPDPQPPRRGRGGAQSLRERGAELLERAAGTEGAADPVHPGFDRIVDQLAPDEARILKLLVNEGAQPIVYVNKAAPLGVGAREVARRLSILGREAGCLRPGLVPAYLDNLVRLGLVAIRRDPVPDEQAYQVVEAQPDVVEAIESVNGLLFRGQSSRRSVHVTDFGRAFCQVCFPPEHLTGIEREVAVADGPQPEPPEPDPDDRVGGTGG